MNLGEVLLLIEKVIGVLRTQGVILPDGTFVTLTPTEWGRVILAAIKELEQAGLVQVDDRIEFMIPLLLSFIRPNAPAGPA